MPRPRFQNLDAARRRQILETAAREFASHGYKAASLNHVIAQLGLSKGVFYYYFDDKADLFGAVVQMVWDTLLPPAMADLSTWEAATFWPRVATLVREARERLRAQPWLMGISRMIYTPPDPKVSRLVAVKLEEGRALQAAWLRRGQELGVVRRDLPEDLLLGLLAALDDASDRWLLENWDHLVPDRRDTVAETLFQLLRTLLEGPGIGTETSPRVTGARHGL